MKRALVMLVVGTMASGIAAWTAAVAKADAVPAEVVALSR